MKSSEIREAFLTFFAEKEHEIVASSSLIPANDPTLLFVNAGMVQFKDTFLGQDKRNYNRATSVQRCLRAGGKHNDLENVGYTARHHTFFEMLGNFSFGDYFKREAIQYGWEFLTETMGLPEDKLWITVYEEDSEAEDIWLKEMGVSAERFSRCGAKDNFWSMGDTGPCGPCSEIFYDHGENVAGGPPGSPDEDGDRYIEIWNLVFMQYDRDSDGNLNPLPKPSVDTGMGLERLAAIMQNGHSNYDIDLFQNLMQAVAAEVGTKEHNHTSVKVIADHIRSCAFLAVDGVVPSNEGRGYVMRRIIRRAIRHGYKLGQEKPFFHKLVTPLVKEMGEAYPELIKAATQVIKVLLKEEERFAETLEQGMVILEDAIAQLSGSEIPGIVLFKLYDTYGFPIDLVADIARERDLSMDYLGYEKEMAAQKELARSASNFKSEQSKGLDIDLESKFSGYDKTEDHSSVVALFQNGSAVTELVDGQDGVVVLESSPFYGESGGQAGDSGKLTLTTGGEFIVEDTQKSSSGAILHIGKLNSEKAGDVISVGSELATVVDGVERTSSARNHSATPLLHAQLRKILGEHVQQKGSQVNSSRLRFDFSHFEPMTVEQLQELEQEVNRQILSGVEIDSTVMSIDDAKATGAMALFGEKYGDEVRVVKVGELSTELCGGTHVTATSDIGIVRIISESGVAAGVRRIEAVTGKKAFEYIDAGELLITEISTLTKSGRDNLTDKVEALVERNRELERELEQVKSKLANASSGDLVTSAQEIGGVNVVISNVEGADGKTLRTTIDQLKDKLGSAAILLLTEHKGKVIIAAGVTKDATSKIKAGDLVKEAAAFVGGKGGGRPDMAQGGGSDPKGISTAVSKARKWAEEVLSS